MEFLIFLAIIYFIARHFYFKLNMLHRLIAKGITVYVLILGCILSGYAFVYSTFETMDEVEYQSLEGRVERIEKNFKKGDYGEIIVSLSLNNCYEEEFDPYWEIAETLHYYSEFLIYQTASENLEEEDAISECEKKMDETMEKLMLLEKNSPYKQNKKVIAYYRNELEK